MQLLLDPTVEAPCGSGQQIFTISINMTTNPQRSSPVVRGLFVTKLALQHHDPIAVRVDARRNQLNNIFVLLSFRSFSEGDSICELLKGGTSFVAVQEWSINKDINDSLPWQYSDLGICPL